MSKILLNHPFMLGFDYLEEALDKLKGDNYPPYDIVQLGEEQLFIKICVAGFVEEDLKITQENNQLVVIGDKLCPCNEEIVYIHKGISYRKFRKVFVLAEGVEPVKSSLQNGLLIIELKKQKIQKDIKIISIDKQ